MMWNAASARYAQGLKSIPSLMFSMPCKDGRALEVSMTLTVAPGLLSGYTKIVRFTPRFVLVNYLERPIRIWQDSSLLHPLYEGMDRPTAISDHKRSKWHFKGESDPSDAVNQYEYLFGRSAALDEENVDGITAGTTANKTALYIATAGKSDVIPFHLPDTRGERQLRIDLGGSWNLTASFSADATGENFFKITRAIDSRLLCHVTTRASPQYKVVLPPQDSDAIDSWNGELGVWFETDWGGDRRIIVQGIKRESYAFNHTDIHVGDELLRVDDFNVSQMTFAETMKVLKEKLAYMSVDRKNPKPRLRASTIMLRRSKRASPNDDTYRSLSTPQMKVVLIFRTLEERLRRVRIKALKARRVSAIRLQDPTHHEGVQALGSEESDPLESRGEADLDQTLRNAVTAVKVDMRMLHHSAFVVVQQPDLENPPFRIENRAMDHVVFFRQRSCSSYPWNQVLPGESLSYTWEEPLRPRKLIVRVGPRSTIVPVKRGDAHNQGETSNHGGEEETRCYEREKGKKDNEMKKNRSKRLKQLLSAQYVKNEEEGGLGASVSVKLEVIGFRDILPCPKASDNGTLSPDDEDYLNCHVDTDGVTRVLIITDKKENEDERTDIRNHVTILQQQILQEESRKGRIQQLRHFFGGEEELPVSPRSIENVDVGEESVKPLPHGASRTETHNEASSGSAEIAVVPNVLSDSIMAQNDTLINNELQNLADTSEDKSITRCNQVYIEIMEAAGLKSNDASGICNPYCEVVLRERSKSSKSFRSKAREKQVTYYIENTTTPKWATQVFIFNVSPEAVHATRGYSVRVRLRNFHFVGNHPTIGQTSVYLSTLRNQQELVGWYPLVGTKERSDIDDSLGSYGHGSVRLRMQWIHSIPGLLDYFLMLSERRLANLQQSVVGMKEQLTHAIETERTREQYADTLGSFPIPDPLSRGLRRKGRLTSGHIRLESREGFDDLIKRKGKLPGTSPVLHLRHNLKKTREHHLWQLDTETAESKRRRRSLSDARMLGAEAKDRMADEGSGGIARIPASSTGQDNRSLGSQGVQTTGPSSEGSKDTGGADGSDHVAKLPQRGRSVSSPDARLSSQSEVLFRDDIGLLNPDILEFSRLVRSHSLGTSSEGQSSIVFDIKNSFHTSENSAGQSQPDETFDALCRRGLIYREGTICLYRDHLVYHFRLLLMESSLGSNRSSVENFRAKSTLRLSPVIREFRSWTAAQAVFNDDDLQTDIFNGVFYLKLKSFPVSSQIDVTEGGFERTSFEGGEMDNHGVSAAQLIPPQGLPSAILGRAKMHAYDLMMSRNRFERACRRSLRAVVNPGGWLTIRPMTALYLPDTFTGMFVKLRYGSEVAVSETVDAKVSPKWAVDTTIQVTSYAHTVTSSGSKEGVFEYGPSDLQVFVDPQRTSGSLRISVFGERLNKSKIELGVLQIPLGAAINCCVECMEEVHEEQSRLHKSLQGSGVPAYVRWFPLMSPKDAVAVDGDLGLSSLPSESEKVRDNMFDQYFTPCIKLALIWQPEEDTSDEVDVQNKFQPTFDADALPESPLAEIYCNADIGRLSFALIDSQRALELVSLYITDIDVRYSVTMIKTTTGLFLGFIQIDYQDDNAREPVILAPTPGDSSQPTLQFVAVKDNLRSKSNITSYEYVWFALQEMDLTLEEFWMFELWDFFMSIMRRMEIRNMSTFGSTFAVSADTDVAREWTVPVRSTPRGSLVEEQSTELTLASLLEDNGPTIAGKKKMYVGQLLLGSVKINLSYLKGKRQNWEVNDRGGLTLRDSGTGLNMTGITIGAGGMLVGRHSGDLVSPTYQKWSERTQDEDLWTETEGE